TEYVLQYWNLCQSRDAGKISGLRIFKHSAHQVGFALTQSHHVLDLSLTDDWLGDTANIGVASHGRDVHCGLQRNVAIRMNRGRYVDVHADIEILKLRVNQWVDTYTADAGLERTGCDRNAFTNLQ